MKKILIIIAIVIAVLVGLFIKFVSFNAPCPPPEKPKDVPVAAVWKGGCDGGNWIELVEIKEDTVRFRIYRDWNGELILDADFKYQKCGIFRLNENNWEECVAGYINGNVGIYINCYNDIKCCLEPIYPVYYEESLE